MKSFVALASAFLLAAFLPSPAPAQPVAARVLAPAPGQVWTIGTGAGHPYDGGYGARPDFRLPGQARAVLFDGTTYLDVTPGDMSGALINDSSGRQHGGGASRGGSYPGFAFLWIDTTPVNLHPEDCEVSEVLGVGGGRQAGYVVAQVPCDACGRAVGRHAASWSGTATSLDLLHAPRHESTVAWDTDGAEHVGQGQALEGGELHALLWNGAAAIDLHPGAAYEQSLACAVASGVQAGSVFGAATGQQLHAARWSGTAASFVDLHPEGYARSEAHAVRQGLVAGSGSTAGEPWRYRALAWTEGSPPVVDLHALLPAEYQAWNSSAEAVGDEGDVIGIVELSGEIRPVLWSTLDGAGGAGAVAVGEPPPLEFSLGRAVPNPSASAVRFRVGLPEAATVEVALYDVRGQRVKSEARRLEAGWQSWGWDGADDAGRRVASGVYFARVTVAGRERGTHKVVLTR